MKILKKVNEVKKSSFVGSGWVAYFMTDGYVDCIACGTNFDGEKKWWRV